MTCGGCSGAVTRVLEKAKADGKAILFVLASSLTILGISRCFILRCQPGEAGGHRQGYPSLRRRSRQDKEDWQGGWCRFRLSLFHLYELT